MLYREPHTRKPGVVSVAMRPPIGIRYADWMGRIPAHELMRWILLAVGGSRGTPLGWAPILVSPRAKGAAAILISISRIFIDIETMRETLSGLDSNAPNGLDVKGVTPRENGCPTLGFR